MPEGFIIMQIGDKELDQACEQAIVPALEACGFDAKRVDKHNKGGLLKNEIIDYIERSDIIVSDLTNERPNCYLEVGYTMGMGKTGNLILTAREDHLPESPNYIKGGPKIHFDLSGYDILFWHPARLDVFRQDLEKRVRRRMAILEPSPSQPPAPWNYAWVRSHREVAMPELKNTKKTGFMEIRFALDPPKVSKNPKELNDAVQASTIRTFGWPIGIHFSAPPEYRPKPRNDGIVAEVAVDDRETYDYWALARNGDYYLLKTIFEDQRDPNLIFFNTRIVRVTETLLFCARLYSRLGVDSNALVNIAIRHGGLRGRMLSAVGNHLIRQTATSAEDEVETPTSSTLGHIESDLVGLVKELTTPLFTLFDFFELPDQQYEEIVNAFVRGDVT